MRLVFSGFENPLELEAGETSVFEIENGALFARVAGFVEVRVWALRFGAIFILG